jgi:amino acid permease
MDVCHCVGLVAVRGIIGSTTVSIVINIIQLTSLVVFSILAIMFRMQNPLNVAPSEWYHPTATSIILPHNLSGMLFQSTIAILILVGFESSTALAADAKNPKRDIPRGVILSLVIQGLFAYLLEYFGRELRIKSRLTSNDGAFSALRCRGFLRADRAHGIQIVTHPGGQCFAYDGHCCTVGLAY